MHSEGAERAYHTHDSTLTKESQSQEPSKVSGKVMVYSKKVLSLLAKTYYDRRTELRRAEPRSILPLRFKTLQNPVQFRQEPYGAYTTDRTLRPTLLSVHPGRQWPRPGRLRP